ncbi:hypothetical protein ACH5RR_040209 [Cinchona calisaya]|uniref:SHSP domain-containing protein n=1 Tax=Cinchona calisaya TaxID=153742 RepID=A0ABD2XVC2_9GENT
MASSLAFHRTAANVSSSPLFKKLFNNLGDSLRPLAAAPSAARSFNTNSQMTSYDEGDRSVDVQRRPDGFVSRHRDSFPSFFSDVFDPFSPTRSVSQLLNMVDQLMDIPFATSPGFGPGPVARRGWDVKEDENAVFIKMDMPGINKENVKITVEDNTMVIKGESEKESEDEASSRRYSSRLSLPTDLYKLDEIKAEMKNGVLKVIVPKAKLEERKDVFEVKVE